MDWNPRHAAKIALRALTEHRCLVTYKFNAFYKENISVFEILHVKLKHGCSFQYTAILLLFFHKNLKGDYWKLQAFEGELSTF